MLKGKVVSGGALVTNVFIINKVTGTETKSDGNGLFAITAKIGDRLVVYNDRIEVREFAVNKVTINEVPFVIEVKPKSYELDEVVITHGITSESLGIVSKNQKKYTPAERRLREAGGSIENFGFTLTLNGIINAITGRLAMLQKAYETEKKEASKSYFDGLFTDTELRDDLKIPEEYLRGFAFYVAEDEACAKAMKAKNDSLAKLLIMELAVKYTALLQNNGTTTEAIQNE